MSHKAGSRRPSLRRHQRARGVANNPSNRSRRFSPQLDPDPIFAAIEKHRAAYAAVDAATLAHSRLEGSGPGGTFQSIEELDTDEAHRVLAAVEDTNKVLDATAELVFSAPPRTLAGLKALALDIDHPYYWGVHDAEYVLDGLVRAIIGALDAIRLPADDAGTPIVTSAPIAPEIADTVLLALGAKLDPVLREWSALLAQELADQALLEQAVFDATGIRLADAPADYGSPYWRKRDEVIASFRHQVSDKDFTATIDRIKNAANPLVAAIFDVPARTLAGLAVKARAAAYRNDELWDLANRDSEMSDTDAAHIVGLIENVWALAGEAPIEVLTVRRLMPRKRK